MRGHIQAVLRGEVRFATGPREEKAWVDVPRRDRRLVVQCRHGRDNRSAPRTDIGGLTSDRVYSLEVGTFSKRDGPPMPMPCQLCGTTWLVPVPALEVLARDRGHRLLPILVDEIPGVSIAP